MDDEAVARCIEQALALYRGSDEDSIQAQLRLAVHREDLEWSTDLECPIEDMPALKAVVSEYLQGDPDSAPESTAKLLDTLSDFLLMMWAPERLVNEHKSMTAWGEKKERLVALLREAADLFDSGQSDEGPRYSLADLHSRTNGKTQPPIGYPDGYGQVQLCIGKDLRDTAAIIEQTPTTGVFPAAYPLNELFFRHMDTLGTRGKAAASPHAAVKGVVVRVLDGLVPEATKSRFQVIADLARRAGIVSATRQNVRATLHKGRT